MTPQEIRDRIATLREAGTKLRRRPASETLDALARVLDGWSDPRSPWRQELEAELPGATGFSPESVREGLALGLEEWSGDALRRLVERELGGAERLDEALPTMTTGFDLTALLLAGAIPMPSLLAMLAPLVLRSPVIAKSASRDPVTPRLVARSIAETDPELGQCVAVVAFPGEDEALGAALLEAECVVATGSDETVAAVRSRVGPAQRLVTHGHRLSLAALGPEAVAQDSLGGVAARLALDVALWDQLGCLSPVAVYATGDVAAVAEALASALATVEERLPRGDVSTAAAAAISHERADAEVRRAAGAAVTLHASEGTGWTVIAEPDARPRPAPLHRFVRVHPVDGPPALAGAVAPLARHLAAVALEGFGADTPALARELADLGASRICAPGRLQRPPLDWPHEGQGVLRPLARSADLELLAGPRGKS